MDPYKKCKAEQPPTGDFDEEGKAIRHKLPLSALINPGLKHVDALGKMYKKVLELASPQTKLLVSELSMKHSEELICLYMVTCPHLLICLNNLANFFEVSCAFLCQDKYKDLKAELETFINAGIELLPHFVFKMEFH